MKVNLQKEYQKVKIFETELSRYTGAPYVVCVDCCTNALFLCLIYSRAKSVIIPRNTYIGVALAALHAQKKIIFDKREWMGVYQLKNTNIYDAAKRLTHNMYIAKTNMCLSFHYKKHLPIGRGGAILTDNKKFYDWLLLARNNGKDVDKLLPLQMFKVPGYNMLLHPDLACKGSQLLRKLPKYNEDLPIENYGDLSKQMKAILN